jgi:hypothetical protein
MKELRSLPRRTQKYALQSGQGTAWLASHDASACASMVATIAARLAIPGLESVLRRLLAKLNLMSWEIL